MYNYIIGAILCLTFYKIYRYLSPNEEPFITDKNHVPSVKILKMYTINDVNIGTSVNSIKHPDTILMEKKLESLLLGHEEIVSDQKMELLDQITDLIVVEYKLNNDIYRIIIKDISKLSIKNDLNDIPGHTFCVHRRITSAKLVKGSLISSLETSDLYDKHILEQITKLEYITEFPEFPEDIFLIPNNKNEPVQIIDITKNLQMLHGPECNFYNNLNGISSSYRSLCYKNLSQDYDYLVVYDIFGSCQVFDFSKISLDDEIEWSFF